ncbi:SpoIIE family protein phosphatase [Modestobacter sp. SSW1-42]|uniref:SpoIIE family protein phosphatase n=1 Tax=Modestobacter sp. SSW1-42 TaxID=596372 RepID=UPI0039866F23
MVLAADWSQTPLGPVDSWSPTLLTAVSTCLNSRFPMLLMWGAELVMVYNDGYAPILGARHPEALGKQLGEVWTDVWSDIEPMIAEVFAGRSTFVEDMPLTMTRHGFPEETYFTFAYSPVLEPGGRVAGLLDTVIDTTPRVLAARRMAVLQRLGSLPRSVHGSNEEACVAALEVLADARADCPFGLVYLEDGDRAARRTASYGLDPADPVPDDALHAAVRQAMATGAVVPIGDLGARLPGVPGAGPVGGGDVETAFALPLTAAGQDRPVGALVLGASPHLRVDAEYLTFLELAAGQVAAAVADAQAVLAERRRAAERAELDRSRAQFFTEVAVTLQRAVLGPTVLPEGFAVHYEPAAGTLEVGGDWYDVVDLPGGLYGVVVGDVVGRGLDAAAVMGQLRSAGRALLLESRSPAHVLSALDRFAALVPGATCSTVFCGVVDPSAATLRYSSAGHPPAVLADEQGRSQLLEAARGVPLAVLEGVDRPEAQVSLPPGSTLLLYTDGLVERRDEALDEGIGRAVTALVAGRHLATDALSGLLTDQLLSDAPDDDVAFLLYRSPG